MSSNAIAKAFAECERSYFAAKASVADVTSGLMAQGPGGAPIQRTDLHQAHEEERHFRGWVYAAIRPIAQRIAGQPIHVGRVKGPKRTKQADNVEILQSHPLLDLLADPNGLMVAWSLIFSTVASLELTGRSLWWLPKKKQIFPIPTSWIASFEGSTEITAFNIRSPHVGSTWPVPADECCYFSYPDPHDPHGAVSPLHSQYMAVSVDEAMHESQFAAFRRGIHPSHAIVVGKQPVDGVPGGMRPRLTDAQQRQIIGAILRRYQGATKHGEPVILDGLIEDIKRLSNNPSEMDWLNSGSMSKARIFQGFGVNPIIAGEIEGANRASATAADKHFIDSTVNPKIELLSQTMTEWLGPMFDGVEVWIEPCIANDADISIQWATLLAANGVLTAHELRKLSPFGLTEESAFDHQLVGGENMKTTNPIAAGIRSILRNELGSMGAENILAQLGTGGNGNG